MDDDTGPPPRRRRPRYRGTHPRGYLEKYKELDPARHPEEAAKVRARGQTPAGTHVPVLVREVIDALEPAPGEVYLDATLGYGGHAERIVPLLSPGGTALGMDMDREVLARTEARLRALGLEIRARHGNFAGADKAIDAEGLDGVDLLLADLGVSSMQLDDPARGFSLKGEAALDLRMDRGRGRPAAEWLATVDEEELARVLGRHGDEPDARAIAAAIRSRALASASPITTRELCRIVLGTKGLERGHRQASALEGHPASRTFQALRIAVNREDENLAQLLRILPWIVRPGGRAAIISFHEGEDRVVRTAIEDGVRAGLWCRCSLEPIRPGREEVFSNPRSRSARLRWAERSR